MGGVGEWRGGGGRGGGGGGCGRELGPTAHLIVASPSHHLK